MNNDSSGSKRDLRVDCTRKESHTDQMPPRGGYSREGIIRHGGHTLTRPRALLSGSRSRLTSSTSSNSASSWPTRSIRDATGEVVLAKDRSASLIVDWASSHSRCQDVGWIIKSGRREGYFTKALSRGSAANCHVAPVQHFIFHNHCYSKNDLQSICSCLPAVRNCRLQGKDAYTRMSKA